MSLLNRRHLLQLSAGLGLSSAAPAWADGDAADWSGDVAILRQTWEAMHPGLYRYNTPQEMDRVLEITERFASDATLRSQLMRPTAARSYVRA